MTGALLDLTSFDDLDSEEWRDRMRQIATGSLDAAHELEVDESDPGIFIEAFNMLTQGIRAARAVYVVAGEEHDFTLLTRLHEARSHFTCWHYGL